MKRTVRALAAVCVGVAMFAVAAAPAQCADEICAMGGTLIKAEVNKDKALDWAKDRRTSAVSGEDGDSWAVLVLSKTSDDIAIHVSAGAVFFGVAGKGGQELDSRDLEKAFGRDLRTLKEAIKKEMGDLWKAGVVKIDGSDVQALSDAAGLGTLEKDRRDWALTTSDCTATDLDASALK